MQYDREESSETTTFVTYIANPPPMEGQDLRAIVSSDGTVEIRLTAPGVGVFVWNGLLSAAPLIYDLLGAVIADNAGTLGLEV